MKRSAQKIQRVKAPVEESVGVLVTVDDDHLPTIQDLAQKLERMGVGSIHASPVLGTITGEAPRSIFSRMEQLEGVANVEPERTVHAINK